jgi:peptide subunit release factor RF-3
MLDTFIEISPQHPEAARLTREKSCRKTNISQDLFSKFMQTWILAIATELPSLNTAVVNLKEENSTIMYVSTKTCVLTTRDFSGPSKSIVDEAYPGDVIGLYDSGNFKIGDTLTEGEVLQFQGIPNFSPEIFKELVNTDPMKTKQLEKGINQLTDEGVAQLFTQYGGNRKIVGTVGELQFEVIQYRLEHEYGASCRFNMLNIFKACWVTAEDKAKLDEFVRFRQHQVATDKDGNIVYLAESQWMLDQMIKNHPDVTFHFTSEFKRQTTEADQNLHLTN